MTTPYPWYDSPWLSVYNQASHLIETLAPDRLAEFTEAFSILTADKNFQTVHLRKFLEDDIQKALSELIANLDQAALEKQEFFTFGRFVVHDHAIVDELHTSVTEIASELAGEALEPSYNFLSLYNNLGICDPHIDAPISKWTLDVCIQQSDLWPINISEVTDWPTDKLEEEANWKESIKQNNTFQQFEMEPRDALFFAGSSQWHYRDRIPRHKDDNFCHLIFFHFIPKGTSELLTPSAWPHLLNLPVLEQMNEVFKQYDEKLDNSAYSLNLN
jgi:hypothetical protein